MSRATETKNPLGFLDEAMAQLRADGLYRSLRILDGEQKAEATFDHKDVINLSSNNYLGLTTHPKLREAALDAVKRLGVGSGSVRTIAGTMELHMELERRIAVFACSRVNRRPTPASTIAPSSISRRTTTSV